MAGWLRVATFLLIGLSYGTWLNAQESRRGGREWKPGPEDLAKVNAQLDLPYQDNPHSRQHLDLFLPNESKDALPVIVWIHGGAWFRGDKSNCPPLREGFVDKGFAVASIGYRLSGDAAFPAQIEDCRAAIRYLKANADKFGIDPERIGVWGSSAGGHLAALLGTSANQKAWDTGANLSQSAQVRAVCDFYGPANFLTFADKRGGNSRPNAPEDRLLGGPISERMELAKKASPVTHVSAEASPFLIFHGDQDRNVDISQSMELRDRLLAEKVECTFKVVEGAGHGSPAFFDPKILEEVEAFFRKHLATK